MSDGNKQSELVGVIRSPGHSQGRGLAKDGDKERVEGKVTPWDMAPQQRLCHWLLWALPWGRREGERRWLLWAA